MFGSERVQQDPDVKQDGIINPSAQNFLFISVSNNRTHRYGYSPTYLSFFSLKKTCDTIYLQQIVS
jgi:hypothetical protein